MIKRNAKHNVVNNNESVAWRRCCRQTAKGEKGVLVSLPVYFLTAALIQFRRKKMAFISQRKVLLELSAVTERRSDIKNTQRLVHLEARHENLMVINPLPLHLPAHSNMHTHTAQTFLFPLAGSIKVMCHHGHFYFMSLQEKLRTTSCWNKKRQSRCCSPST